MQKALREDAEALGGRRGLTLHQRLLQGSKTSFGHWTGDHKVLGKALHNGVDGALSKV